MGENKLSNILEVTLSYDGKNTDNHEIDFYDVSQALIGFQRTLALTTHLVLNNQIITQAPALKNAQIFALPPEEGSWKIKAGIALTGLYAVTTTPQNTVLGHLVFSIYDYVISESIGKHVDFNKSLGQLYEEANEKKVNLKPININKADSLIEKCETAIKDIHRPIFKTESANRASFSAKIGNANTISHTSFTIDSYNYLDEYIIHQEPSLIKGRISSYNSNTFKGRIYSHEEGRPISFELQPTARGKYHFELILASLSAYTKNELDDEWLDVYCKVQKVTSKLGHLKSYKVLNITHNI
jgi:hypothetical protein